MSSVAEFSREEKNSKLARVGEGEKQKRDFRRIINVIACFTHLLNGKAVEGASRQEEV